jgi:hypothetical protein
MRRRVGRWTLSSTRCDLLQRGVPHSSRKTSERPGCRAHNRCSGSSPRLMSRQRDASRRQWRRQRHCRRYRQDGGALHSASGPARLSAVLCSGGPQMACCRRAVRSAKHRSATASSPASAPRVRSNVIGSEPLCIPSSRTSAKGRHMTEPPSKFSPHSSR